MEVKLFSFFILFFLVLLFFNRKQTEEFTRKVYIKTTLKNYGISLFFLFFVLPFFIVKYGKASIIIWLIYTYIYIPMLIISLLTFIKVIYTRSVLFIIYIIIPIILFLAYVHLYPEDNSDLKPLIKMFIFYIISIFFQVYRYFKEYFRKKEDI